MKDHIYGDYSPHRGYQGSRQDYEVDKYRCKVNICPFCGDPVSYYPNNGAAHYDCARDFEIWEYKINKNNEDM